VSDHTHHLQQILQRAPAIHRTTPPTGGGGHADKFALTLDGGIAVLAKPGKDDLTVLLARCEVAAWRVACLLGWSDLMPATALRDVGTTPGTEFASVQILWPLAQPKDLAAFSPEMLWRAAVFDRLIEHSDRSLTNWIAVEDATNVWHLKLIDNGYAFGTSGRSLASEIVNHVRALGQPFPPALRAAVANLSSQLPDDYLSSLIPAAGVTDLAARAVDLASSGDL
jgi:hypothetical protein